MAKVDPGAMSPGPGGLVGPAYGDLTGKAQTGGGWKETQRAISAFVETQRAISAFVETERVTGAWVETQRYSFF